MGEGYIGPLYSETNCQSNYFIIKFFFKKRKNNLTYGFNNFLHCDIFMCILTFYDVYYSALHRILKFLNTSSDPEKPTRLHIIWISFTKIFILPSLTLYINTASLKSSDMKKRFIKSRKYQVFFFLSYTSRNLFHETQGLRGKKNAHKLSSHLSIAESFLG